MRSWSKVHALGLMVLITGIMAAAPVVAVAGSEAELQRSQRRLNKIQQQIDKTVKDLRGKQVKAGSLASDLTRLNDETRRLAKRAQGSSRKLAELDKDIRKSQAAEAALNSRLEALREQVVKRLRVLYKNGEVGMAKVLLSASDTPAQLAEKFTMLTRLVRRDRQLIEDYRMQVAAQQQARQELGDLRDRQAAVHKRYRREQATLQSAGKSKRKLLADLRKDETLLAGYLAGLRAKAARLGSLVKKLESDIAHSYTGTATAFAKQKGRLVWPVRGRLRVGFGTSRNTELGTMLESNGLEIGSPSGTAVNAVWTGKVLYASDFRGYGKLMIIDHGNKYFTLYAQMNRFMKQVGEQVTSGEVIAYSGFEGRDYVYFEIRHNGQPVDPRPWLSSQ